MDKLSIPYLDLLLVACGFLILQYLQIVLIARFGFGGYEKLAENGDSFHYSYQHHSGTSSHNSGASRRHSFSSSATRNYSKRRGRRTFGIKHL